MLDNSAPLLATTSVASPLAELARDEGWLVMSQDDALTQSAQRVCLVELGSDDRAGELKHQFHQALFVDTASASKSKHADFCLPPQTAIDIQKQILEHAKTFWQRNVKVLELAQDVAMRRHRMHQLNEISMALTAEMPQQELLRTILTEAQRIAGCEGGSLFLSDGEGEAKTLVFKLALNNVVDFPFEESRLPFTAESIAGYVAVTGQELNIEDVYQLDADAPYRFNRSFDELMGYRSQSVLAIPMRDHRDQVVGVLQFVNRRDVDDNVVPFGEEIAEVLRAIASQAAVSLQKNTLLEDINQLFESFVQASVKAIEHRDPSTSGHSFRVAQTTVALLEALPDSGVSRFRNLQLSDEHIREVRYAALLHDFGKIGVPEAVLVKANKLSDDRLEVIRFRIELQKERLRRRAAEQELDLLHHQPIGVDVARRRVHRQLDKQISVLDQYFECIVRANNPNVLESGDFDHLNEIREYAFRELDGTVGGVITDHDLMALSVRRGSLTPEERRQIQSHVVHTTEFLSVLPWPPELAQIPEIAGAHHERMDGSGYPQGLVGEQIPLASRVMAVCDVYDALTAMDRPYKPAMSQESAFDILYDEARRGLLDSELVDIFLASGTFKLREAS